jgi:hypothetical protein
MTSSNGEQEAARLERAVSAYAEMARKISPEFLASVPAEGEWTIGELTAHSAEIYHYWAVEVQKLKSNPHQPFGRTATDSERIAFVEQHQNDPLPALIETMERGASEAAAVLRSFSDEEWRTVTGQHSARGIMDMDFISNLFIAGHAEEHLKQLEETLSTVGAKG